MSRIHRLLILTLGLNLALSNFGCSSRSELNEPGNDKRPALAQADDYFPLDVGSKCTYAIEYIAFGVGGQKGRAASRIDGEETISGNSYYRLVTVYSGIPGAESETTFYRKTATGVFVIQGKHKDHPEVLYLPLPLKVGLEWTTTLAEMTIHNRVVSNETAQLFDKGFENSFKISFEFDRKTDQGISHVKGYKYLAPNTGLVKEFDDVENRFQPRPGETIIYPKNVKIDLTIEACSK